MNLLPFYNYGEKIECLNHSIGGNYLASFYFKEDNFIPPFLTPIFEYLTTPEISTFKIHKVNTENLINGILETTPALTISNEYLTLETIQPGVYRFYMQDEFLTIIETPGVYQVYITLTDDTIFYSDIFYLNGIYEGGILTEQWIIINAESEQVIVQEIDGEIKISEFETTTITAGAYVPIIIPDGEAFLNKKILAENLAGADRINEILTTGATTGTTIADTDYLTYNSGLTLKKILFSAFKTLMNAIYGALSNANVWSAFQKFTVGTNVINGSYRYHAASATADTLNDIRIGNNAGALLLQKCTVANATKGAGTWVSVSSGVALDVENIWTARQNFDGGINFETGDYFYFATSKTADTVGDKRIYISASIFYMQRCTVANATKGAGTWASDYKIDSSGYIYPYIGYKSVDGTIGITVTKSFFDGLNNSHTVTVKNGIITSWTTA